MRALAPPLDREAGRIRYHLTPEVQRLIHRLARDRQVGDSGMAVSGCSFCTEMIPPQSEGPNQ